jgi:hypothetical protein
MVKVTGSSDSIRLGSITTSTGSVDYWVRNRDDDSLVVSSGHRKTKSGWSGGGGFYVVHDHLVSTQGPLFSGNNINGPFEYRPVVSNFTTFTGATPAALTKRAYTSWNSIQSSLTPKGSTGWNRARPGNPTASIGQTLAELGREGLPSLPLRLLARTKSMRALGSEYLNAQFGWVPLVNDIRKMYHTWQTLDRQLAQIHRDNGRAIRRRRTLENNHTTSVTTDVSGSGPLFLFPSIPMNGNFGLGKYRYTVTSETHLDTWFVGRFHYFIPDVGSSQWKRRTVRALFGANLTPDLVYNLVPWSWLVDWFSNVGDVVSNASRNAVDNLVADYAYVMTHSKTVQQYTLAFSGCPGFVASDFKTFHNQIPPFSVTFTDHREYKSRVAATPYGFGISFDGLSAYQTSILAALGLSRSRF